MKTQILIVGTGCSGLYCALNLCKTHKVTLITKSDLESSDSFLAQGGMCVLNEKSDFASFFDDTLKAGHYENDKKSVEIMINSSPDILLDLQSFGADFEKDENGNLKLTKEGGHSNRRIVFHKDITGAEITSALLNKAKVQENIEILEYTTLIDLVCENNDCFGAICKMQNGDIQQIDADYVVLATGGVGGLYTHSTNFSHLTADSIALAQKHNIELKDINYVQIHPTTFYSANQTDRSFLISESVRGEGAKLYNKSMKRFVNELLPRDLLTQEIYKQMKKDKTQFVWLDMSCIPTETLKSHFPNILEFCQNQGFDVTKQCIPVVPAQHYFMGGIKVNYESKTSMNRLYAIGETACNGVHGKNRLASNSLLESLVFAKRAAFDIIQKYQSQQQAKNVDLSMYKDPSLIMLKNEQIARDLICSKDEMHKVAC